MSADSPAERYANALANVRRAERELAEATDFLRRAAEGMPRVNPTAKRPERYWQARGYEFMHCGKCGHRFFGAGMAPAIIATVLGPCSWCRDE